METSIFLARVIGLVSVISTLLILIRYKKSMAFEKESSERLSSIYTSGFVFLILGILILVSHFVWLFNWRVVITFIGLIIIIKGIGRILFPEAVKRMIDKKQDNQKFMIGEMAVFLIGLYLLYYGFIRPVP